MNVDGLTRTSDHRYHWTEYGVTHVPEGVPGVTTVLKQVDKSGAFWAAASRLVAEYAVEHSEFLASMIEREGAAETVRFLAYRSRRRQEKAMDLGTHIHAFAEDYARGQGHLFEPQEEAKSYLVNFGRDFIEKYSPTFEHIEAMVYSIEHRYGGTLDAICGIDPERCPAMGTAERSRPSEHAYGLARPCRWLIDYKTSDKPIGLGEREFPYPDVGLQLAALGYADFIGKENDGTRYPIPPIDHYGVVAITPDGCELVPYEVTREEFDTFLAYRVAHDWHTQRKGSIKHG